MFCSLQFPQGVPVREEHPALHQLLPYGVPPNRESGRVFAKVRSIGQCFQRIQRHKRITIDGISSRESIGERQVGIFLELQRCPDNL